MTLQYKNNQWWAGELNPSWEDRQNASVNFKRNTEAFKPIAPNDQEKIHRRIFDLTVGSFQIPYIDWKPDSKLYDSGDLVFELEQRYLIDGEWTYVHRSDVEMLPDESFKPENNKQFWVLKEKAKEEISKELRSVRKDLFSPCEKAILNAQYELEKVGASEELTKAAILLSEARQLVTNYLYEKNN